MSRIFFGKFDSKKPQQIQEKYYAAGAEGNSWYGGIRAGDYVFVVTNSNVISLWKVREYGNKANPTNPNDPRVVLFDEVISFPQPIPVSQFIKSPYFHVDINLLNKINKSTLGYGFFPIETTSLFPFEQWDKLSFAAERHFYIVLSTQDIPLKEHDVLIVINNLEEARIIEFLEWKDGRSQPYSALRKLYEDRNPENERYTLHELLEFAEEEAPNKRNYLRTVLVELEQRGYFAVNNPIRLYDNVLVGRRKTPKSNAEKEAKLNVSLGGNSAREGEEPEMPELYEHYETFADLLDFNPNLILYGPPGTGKTFAVKHIIEAFEYKFHKRYVSFSQVEKDERVRFITFHQSYSYEEFIEGIRPQIDGDEKQNTDSGDIRYKVESGVLKQIVEAASAQIIKAESQQFGIKGAEFIRSNSRVWKVSLGPRNDDQIYKQCKQEGYIAVNWLDGHDLSNKSYEDIYSMLKAERGEEGQNPTMDANTLETFISQMNKGDIVFIYDGPWTIRDIGVITGDYIYLRNRSYPHARKVTWLKEFEEPADISDINGGIRLTLKTIYELPRIQMSDVHKLLGASNEPGTITKKQSVKQEPYYLIIDEINRGNISKIFGELMTLIEKDKRQTVSVILPYSKKPFTLPRNLYIIGTMNTSDRSIAMLDTALRRRFAFIEVEPDYSVFDKNTTKVGAVELSKLLRSINEKIADKLDRDHRIGHAYLMDVLTIDDLFKSWYYKILPLIAEYFYNDVTAMQSVVGSKFIDKTGSIRFLSTLPSGAEKVSEFEQALIAIYKGMEL
ncbi:AAA family ATPase [Paenibacillus thailandensis]|uniref:AAA family ATPase n=2 Tax=Paenibacillus thailandensis TaxID=393250 RepID=A0ABW5QZN5_9BACL